MLKFWKKKTTEPAAPEPTAPEDRVDQVADPVAAEVGASMSETLAETAQPEPAAPEVEVETEESAVVEAAREAEQPARRSWRERLSGSGFAKSLTSLFVRHPKLDDDLLDELETALITADVGVDASTRLVEDLRKRMHKREFADAGALLKALRAELVALLKPVEQQLDVATTSPFVILTVGINGVGKTTTIGKLAKRQMDDGRRVVLAAGSVRSAEQDVQDRHSRHTGR